MKHATDTHVGRRIRQRRWLTGKTQKQLAELVGIKFQQIQKYETGANRVSASRLWDIAQALDVPVAFFFDGLKRAEKEDSDTSISPELLENKETMDLVRTFHEVPEGKRRHLLDLTRALSEAA